MYSYSTRVTSERPTVQRSTQDSRTASSRLEHRTVKRAHSLSGRGAHGVGAQTGECDGKSPLDFRLAPRAAAAWAAGLALGSPHHRSVSVSVADRSCYMVLGAGCTRPDAPGVKPSAHSHRGVREHSKRGAGPTSVALHCTVHAVAVIGVRSPTSPNRTSAQV